MHCYLRVILLVCIPFVSATAIADGELTLNEAEQIALDRDPLAKGFTARAEGFDEQAVAVANVATF